MKMYSYKMTIGLNDQNTKKEKYTVEESHEKVKRILLNHYNIYAFTMSDCYGCYTHANGEIVQEKSIRIEIASDRNINEKIQSLIKSLKHKQVFNQESIMLETSISNIDFK